MALRFFASPSGGIMRATRPGFNADEDLPNSAFLFREDWDNVLQVRAWGRGVVSWDGVYGYQATIPVSEAPLNRDLFYHTHFDVVYGGQMGKFPHRKVSNFYGQHPMYSKPMNVALWRTNYGGVDFQAISAQDTAGPGHGVVTLAFYVFDQESVAKIG